MSKLYLLSFDPHKSDAVSLHRIIKESDMVDNWSHYLASSYVLKSKASATEISDYIVSRWPKNRFFIAEISSENRNGWMPMKMWDWLRRHK